MMRAQCRLVPLIGSLLFATREPTAVWGSAACRAANTCSPVDCGWKFDFRTHKPHKGSIQVLPASVFSSQLGYGFRNSRALEAFEHGVCSHSPPFLFSIQMPEGNYDVKIGLGGDGESTTTVKAEARRLLIEGMHLSPGQARTLEFTVNVRSPKLNSGEMVRLDAHNEFDWDGQLTLEFVALREPARSQAQQPRITVYLAGDSTVTDQRRGPWAAW